MAMTYDAFLDQMKKDLEAGFAEDLPAKYSQVKIGIRDVEKLQGESYRGISFRVGDAPIEGNLNMQQAFRAYEAGTPYESILRDIQEAIMQMNLLNHNFFVYRDAQTEDVNVVYRRDDGDYGLIESGN